MIDIHCHILPGLDDGAQDVNQSIEMARQAVAQGIHSVIATPHHSDGFHWNEPDQVIGAIERLNQALALENIPLHIYSGQEIRVYGQCLKDCQEGRLLTLAGSKYLLLELPAMQMPVQIYRLIEQIQMIGFIPIIAHPERNFVILNDPGRLSDLVDRGALCQLTSHSIAGKRGKKLQELCFELCKRHLIHFIASDAHNVSNRGFLLSEAYEAVDKALGREYREYYMNNSERLASDLPIEKLLPVKPKKKSYFFINW
ncbi:tyrosine-protein phosphatase [Paenibacillus alkalitolerans]|uniref:tyrosine-protein phosphatase n=1 Tax=Paenibacillus alkalitolerans TaxID=2799335 RepID=UPI0018F2F105|nr:CpsB/CapC family capsule biosynthesis tyrosine phosphatase [Paenibacillus alkalitolerans]